MNKEDSILALGFYPSSKPCSPYTELKSSTKDYFVNDRNVATAYLEYAHICLLENGDWYEYDDIDNVPELLLLLGIINDISE